ncbi:MAG: formylglycine-generating enzyme family protein [Micropepsaceae bacterium]
MNLKTATAAIIVLAWILAGCDHALAAQDCKDCPNMVQIPSGEYRMGTSAGEYKWADDLGSMGVDVRFEVPQHTVTVRAFWMGVTEITRRQYSEFVRETNYQFGGCHDEGTYDAQHPRREYKYDWRHPFAEHAQSDDEPVVCVNQSDALAYIDWLNKKAGKHYRLPSEAEWEYATRAGTTTGRYWGWRNVDTCKYENAYDLSALGVLHSYEDLIKEHFDCADRFVFTSPVATFSANGFGLWDTMGNVMEWVTDCFHPSYINAPVDGSAWVAGDCRIRVVRGGYWGAVPSELRSGFRMGLSPTARHNNLGFRVARSGV